MQPKTSGMSLSSDASEPNSIMPASAAFSMIASTRASATMKHLTPILKLSLPLLTSIITGITLVSHTSALIQASLKSERFKVRLATSTNTHNSSPTRLKKTLCYKKISTSDKPICLRLATTKFESSQAITLSNKESNVSKLSFK